VPLAGGMVLLEGPLLLEGPVLFVPFMGGDVSFEGGGGGSRV